MLRVAPDKPAPMLLGVVTFAALYGQSADLTPMLRQVAAQAEAFRRAAPTLEAEETLNQKTTLHYETAFDSEASRKPAAPAFETREVASEYTFASLAGAPGALHEFRKVVSVDGRQITSREKARHALTLGLNSPDDKKKKALLEEFEKHGLHGAVTDFGQLLLLFSPRRMADYEFRLAGERPLGADRLLALHYRQIGGAEALTVFRGNTAERQPLEGDIWVRKSDGLPVRVTLTSVIRQHDHAVRDEAQVDYSPTPFGSVMPASVVHREFFDQDLISENIFHYGPFRKLPAAP